MDINRYIRGKLGVLGESLPFAGRYPSSRETTLPEIFFELGYKVGAEIGTQRAVYSKILLEKNPNLKLYCIDPWESYVHEPRQSRQDEHYKIAVANLKGLNAEIIRKTSKDALSDIPDDHLDFVYLDGLHDFDNVMLDIIEWSKKVRPGGIMSGHDYFYDYRVRVVFAVDAYTRAHNIQQWFITRDCPNSWFWVK